MEETKILGGARSRVLADGTPFEDLIDLERREVSGRVVSDPEIYRRELDMLWDKAWLVVGHESELRKTGDFVTRFIGEDPVIVTRGRDGGINVLLNVCQHRGMEVCRAEIGNSTRFRCIYHGWVYDETGAFLAAPVATQRMHGDIYSKEKLGLVRARVGTHAGLVFATFDEHAPSLADYLGDMAWYLNLFFARTDDGLEVVGPPQRFIVPGNWKLAAEQFVGGDTYHIRTLHSWLFELGVIPGGGGSTEQSLRDGGFFGVDVGFPQGHSVRCVPPPQFLGERTVSPLEHLAGFPPAGMTPELVPQLRNQFDDEQLRILADFPPTVGGLFPNVATFNFHLLSANDQLASVTGFHTFVPKGPDSLEFIHWTLVERSAPEEFKRIVRQTTSQHVGVSGQIEQDDGETWPATTRAYRGSRGRRQTIKYQAFDEPAQHPENWPAGGIPVEGFSKDDAEWLWWRRYFEFMVGKAW